MSFSFSFNAKNVPAAIDKVKTAGAPESVKAVIIQALSHLGETCKTLVSVAAHGHLGEKPGDYTGNQTVAIEVRPLVIED